MRHEDVGTNANHLIGLFERVDDDLARIRDLIAVLLEDGLAKELRRKEALGLVGEFVLGKIGWVLDDAFSSFSGYKCQSSIHFAFWIIETATPCYDIFGAQRVNAIISSRPLDCLPRRISGCTQVEVPQVKAGYR